MPRVHGIDYSLMGTSIVVESDDDGDGKGGTPTPTGDAGASGEAGFPRNPVPGNCEDECEEEEKCEADEEEDPEEDEEECEELATPPVKKKPACLAEPPTVQQLLGRAVPHFDLTAAKAPAPSSSASTPAASDNPSIVVELKGATPAATIAPVAASEASDEAECDDAAEAPAKRGSRNLVQPDEWASRHRELLDKMPREALPPKVPHGPDI
jgi:hypothetical protein